MSSDYVRVGRADEFPNGEIKKFAGEGLEVAIVSWRDKFFAFTNQCTHMGYAFHDGGFISPDNEIICTAHFACYDIETGDQVDGPGYSGLAIFDVKVEDGDVLVARLPK